MKQIYVVEQYKNQNKNLAKPLVSPVLDKLDFRVLFLKEKGKQQQHPISVTLTITCRIDK